MSLISSSSNQQSSKSSLLRFFLLLLPILSSYLIYKYMSLNHLDRLFLFNFEKNIKWKNYIDKFKNQTLNFKESDLNRNSTCDCFKKQIDLDLSSWNGTKLTPKLLSANKNLGVHYQIINNKLYRQKDCLFQFRCKGIEYYLLKALKQNKFKNIDLLINVHDWPQIYNSYKKKDLFPVLSFSKDVDLFKGTFLIFHFFT